LYPNEVFTLWLVGILSAAAVAKLLQNLTILASIKEYAREAAPAVS